MAKIWVHVRLTPKVLWHLVSILWSLCLCEKGWRGGGCSRCKDRVGEAPGQSNIGNVSCFTFYPTFSYMYYFCGLPRWLSGKEFTCQCKRQGFDPWVRKILWRRKWQPTPVFLPGKSHGQRSLVGYSPWGHKRVGRDWVTKEQHNYLLSFIYHSFGLCREGILYCLNLQSEFTAQFIWKSSRVNYSALPPQAHS